MNKFNGRVFVDFLSKEECQTLLDFAISSDLWTGAGDPIYNNRVIHFLQCPENSDIRNKAIEIRNKIKETILKEYNFDNIYEDNMIIVRWYKDMFQPPHADSYNPDGSKNGCSWRDFGVVIYLNDDYSGGRTYYTKYGIEVTPKAGTIVIHPSDLDHNHGVTKIDGNIRYTLASFWTKNINYANMLQ